MNRRQFVLTAAGAGVVFSDVAACGGSAITKAPLRGEKDGYAGHVTVSFTEIEHLKSRGIDPREALRAKLQNLERSMISLMEDEGWLG